MPRNAKRTTKAAFSLDKSKPRLTTASMQEVATRIVVAELNISSFCQLMSNVSDRWSICIMKDIWPTPERDERKTSSPGPRTRGRATGGRELDRRVGRPDQSDH